jgi:hypothetical protein
MKFIGASEGNDHNTKKIRTTFGFYQNHHVLDVSAALYLVSVAW